ncbi:MAG: glycosyltransferase [Chitinophagales bacterium]
MANILYISYDGMTDALGQSQVLPYLLGLQKKGHTIHILSTEKPSVFSKKENQIKKLIHEKIEWHYIFYTKKPPLLSTIKDINALNKKAEQLHKQIGFDILHCRSYISALVGLKMKRKFGTKFLFDMRGFWADERVDGKIWNIRNPIFSLVYKYFKKKEVAFLENADVTISLTHNAKAKILNFKTIKNNPIDIEVIPCCVDLDRFDEAKLKKENKSALRSALGIEENEFVLTYLGSIGTWYMLEEMLDFFKVLLKHKPNSKFLFVTAESKEYIFSEAAKRKIPKDRFVITKADYTEVPLYLSLSNYAVFFILPVFSKSASSPIKQGEIMSMGVPIICNAGVGDTDYVLNKYDCGFLVQDFNESNYEKIISKLDSKIWNKEIIRNAASEFYALDNGIESYNNAYKKILQ